MIERPPTGEREPSRWERMTGSPESIAALRTLFRDASDSDLAEFRGFILKRENDIVGYVQYVADDRGDLYIADVFIDEPERSPLIGARLIEMIRLVAAEHGSLTVSWQPVSDSSRRLTDRLVPIATRRDPGDGSEILSIPVEQLSINALLGRL